MPGAVEAVAGDGEGILVNLPAVLARYIVEDPSRGALRDEAVREISERSERLATLLARTPTDLGCGHGSVADARDERDRLRAYLQRTRSSLGADLRRAVEKLLYEADLSLLVANPACRRAQLDATLEELRYELDREWRRVVWTPLAERLLPSRATAPEEERLSRALADMEAAERRIRALESQQRSVRWSLLRRGRHRMLAGRLAALLSDFLPGVGFVFREVHLRDRIWDEREGLADRRVVVGELRGAVAKKEAHRREALATRRRAAGPDAPRSASRGSDSGR
jgi:hypothetical protein